MKNSKLRAIFGLGRRWIFTLALFLFVFALASVVKIQAGTEHSATGWMWGGSDDGAGNNTGVGWISANSTNQGGSVNYGVNIPNGNGNVTGYAWSENIGWIQFDPAGPYPAGPNYSTKRAGINLEGWARIVSIKDALAAGNSGGWQGWVKMKGSNYGVTIGGSNLSGYGWSDELGWIDFSRVNYTIVPYIDLTPASFSLGGTSQALRAEIKDATPAGQTITFAKSGANPNKFNLSANSCVINTSGWCEVNVTAADRTSAYTATITASSSGFTSDSSEGTIIQILDCTISCPSSVEVISGQTKDYDVSISGPAGCNSLDSCDIQSNSYEISVIRLDGNTCRVTSSGTNRAGSAKSTATAGTGNCDTTVYIKGPGWVETNPQ